MNCVYTFSRYNLHSKMLLKHLRGSIGDWPDSLPEHFLSNTLVDQTQVDSKPAGQPEHASLNQCQLIAANRQKLVLWAPPTGGGDKVSQ